MRLTRFREARDEGTHPIFNFASHHRYDFSQCDLGWSEGKTRGGSHVGGRWFGRDGADAPGGIRAG